MKLTAYLFLMMASAFSASCSKSDNPTKTQELIVLDPVAISKTNKPAAMENGAGIGPCPTKIQILSIAMGNAR